MVVMRLGNDNLATQPGKLTTTVFLEIAGRVFPATDGTINRSSCAGGESKTT